MFHPHDLVRYHGRLFTVLGYDNKHRVVLVDDEGNHLAVRESELENI